jgi:hypothetical protein
MATDYLTGKPTGQVSTVGPLTPEGASIWDEYMKMLSNTPATKNINFGGQGWTINNPQRMGLLKALGSLDTERKGILQQTPETTGLLGRLAPLLAALGGNKGLGSILKELFPDSTPASTVAEGNQDNFSWGSDLSNTGTDVSSQYPYTDNIDWSNMDFGY